MLFDQRERPFQGPKSYTESDYEYLNRSARIEAQRVRAFLNLWIGQYPGQHRDELISRLKSDDDRSFRSATFEIILFAVLRSIGCQITVHPDLNSQVGTHPDFLVMSEEGETAFLEAVLASEHSEADISARKRTDVVLSAIEKIDSPNFFLGVNAEGHPDKPPSGKRLRSQLEQWLFSLDPDYIAHQVEQQGSDAIPKMEWEEEGWKIVFDAIPKKAEKRGKGQRVIGTLFGGARFVNSWAPIRDAIKAKGNRYGELDLPFIVAVNVDAIHVDRIDEMQGLFGEEEYVFKVGDPSPPEMRRKPNGAWHGPKGPQYTRVSGPWLFGNLNVWNIVSRANTLYFNPWGAKAIPEVFTVLDHARPAGDKMRWADGRSLGQILGLSAGWPE
jgi:hypothetical protein